MEEYNLKFNKGKTKKTKPVYKKALKYHVNKEARKVGYSQKLTIISEK